VPVVGTTFTTAEVLADPIAANTALGTYTHCGNLLDLCAAVVPSGLTDDGRPSAVMVLGPALSDDVVLAVAAELAGEPMSAPMASGPTPAEKEAVTLVVVGHHLSGQPRNDDLRRHGAVLTELTSTAAKYRLVRIGTDSPVPGLVRAEASGAAIEVETWSMPSAALGEILSNSAPAVCLGRVELADGRIEIGFVADASMVDRSDTEDISAFGGWRNYLSALRL